MKLEGVIYFYCPKESDLKDRAEFREHLIRPTAGRVFLQTDEHHQWTIPFGSTTHLVSILNEVRTSNIDDARPEGLGFTAENKSFDEARSKSKDDRRCLRVLIADVDAALDPMCHAHYLGEEGLEKQKISKFCSKSTGQFTLLDEDQDYKHRYTYFTDMFDAGIQLDKIFSREVAKRIPVEEPVNIPYDMDD